MNDLTEGVLVEFAQFGSLARLHAARDRYGLFLSHKRYPEVARARRELRDKRGLCECGRVRVDGKKACEGCLERKRRSWVNRAARVERGECCMCAATTELKKSGAHYTRCAACREKQNARYRAKVATCAR